MPVKASVRVAEPNLSSPIVRWLARSGIELLEFQQSAYRAVTERKSGIVQARTGSGKSLAMLLPFFGSLLQNASAKARPRAIWVTPLRALAQNLAGAARSIAEGIGMEIDIGVRTGDTSASLRRKQLAKLPELLITTPESLHLLLSYPGISDRFHGLELIVADEWHELFGTKRGVLVELALTVLDRHFPDHLRWGLSATTGDPGRAAAALLGPHRTATVVINPSPPDLEIETLLPQRIERFPWGGHLGFSLAADVAARARSVKSCLLFTNTRFQAESWYQKMKELMPDLEPLLAIHHGSLSDIDRQSVEERLRKGEIRLCVCTASLDLGVDLPEVDLVIQVGSARGVNRLIQRAGRSGHTPDGTSRLLLVPSHALEIVDAEASKRAVRDFALDTRLPLTSPFDMLLQFLTTRACGEGFTTAEMLADLHRTSAYHNLRSEDLETALEFLTRGGRTFGAYEEFRRLSEEQGIFKVASPQIAKRHRMSFGVIVSDESVLVRYVRGGSVGTVEESFIASLRPGESFLLGGKPLELIQVRNMTAYVRKASHRPRSIPRWLGGTLPFTSSFAASVQKTLGELNAGESCFPETLGPLLDVQKRWSAIPSGAELVIESSSSRWGAHLFLFPLEGRSVHEGIAHILARRLAARRAVDISIAVNDYGIELVSPNQLLGEGDNIRELLCPNGALLALEQEIDLTELERRAFREIARIAGLTFQGYPGAKKQVRQLQASASLLFDVLRKYEPGHPLVLQARETVLVRQLELPRIEQVLTRLSSGPIRAFETERFTPFAFPLVIETMRDQVSSVPFEERVRRLQQSLEQQADKPKKKGKRMGRIFPAEPHS